MKITVLLVKPNDIARVKRVRNDRIAFEMLLGGESCIYRTEKVGTKTVVYFGMVEKDEYLPYNRVDFDENNIPSSIIRGSFLICCWDGDEFSSLLPKLIERYDAKYFYPDEFECVDDKINVYRCNYKLTTFQILSAKTKRKVGA